jgi:hypothetical protein
LSNLGLILVAGVAAFFFTMGALALVRPEQVVAYFGTSSLTRDGRSEVRAVYGGFGVAISLLLLATLWLSEIRAGIFVAVAAALVGMALGRLVSLVVDGSPGFFPWLFLGVELFLAGALILALRSIS